MEKTKSRNQGSGKSVRRALFLEQIDLATNFYDVANDDPGENFPQITARVLPRGFGRSKTAAALKSEARRMFNLAR